MISWLMGEVEWEIEENDLVIVIVIDGIPKPGESVD